MFEYNNDNDNDNNGGGGGGGSSSSGISSSGMRIMEKEYHELETDFISMKN
jgi:hypothetical protein